MTTADRPEQAEGDSCARRSREPRPIPPQLTPEDSDETSEEEELRETGLHLICEAEPRPRRQARSGRDRDLAGSGGPSSSQRRGINSVPSEQGRRSAGSAAAGRAPPGAVAQ
eukprot:TRINITY_DN15832_c0_g1_i2.p2 TRINITY_DN15832_c0_g1~~TRINITY_DN15832_c0_g1_i2.p2  ORF type:complete len:112 (+),score=11.31 TRINITY_DN15832_c0_g1_i2:172-507(+)